MSWVKEIHFLFLCTVEMPLVFFLLSSLSMYALRMKCSTGAPTHYSLFIICSLVLGSITIFEMEEIETIQIEYMHITRLWFYDKQSAFFFLTHCQPRIFIMRMLVYVKKQYLVFVLNVSFTFFTLRRSLKIHKTFLSFWDGFQIIGQFVYSLWWERMISSIDEIDTNDELINTWKILLMPLNRIFRA